MRRGPAVTAIGAVLLILGPGAGHSGAQAQTARVSGRLVTADGRTLLSGAVMMTALDSRAEIVPPEDVRVFPDGQFSFGRVAPGTYQIRARGQTQTNGPTLFATFRVDVEGRDIANIEMTLKQGAIVSGQVALEAARARKAPMPPHLTVRAPFIDGSDFGDALTGRVERDGSFVIRGLVVGTHHFLVEGLPEPWTVKTVLLHGRDVTDRPFDVDGDQPLRDVRITLAQRFSEVTGRVLDARNAPARDVCVIVFSSSPQFWIPGGQRVRVVKTDDDGRFAVRGLAAGGYLAVARPAQTEWWIRKAKELEALRAAATEVTLSSDEAKATVDLRLAADRPPAGR